MNYIRRLLYRYFSGDYLHVLHLVAMHYREQRIRAGMCYAPGCQQDGIVWLDRSGIYCWDHYCEQMQKTRAHFQKPCPGCDGHECDDGCQYPGAVKPTIIPKDRQKP